MLGLLPRLGEAILAYRRAAIPARVHGGPVAPGACLPVFHLGQIERTGRWVHTGDRHVHGTPGVHDGGDGRLDWGRDGDSALRFSGSQLFTAAVWLRSASPTPQPPPL